MIAGTEALLEVQGGPSEECGASSCCCGQGGLFLAVLERGQAALL